MATDLIELVRRILGTISRHQMLRAGERAGIGVSGGSDSVALLHILQQLSEKLGIRLAVLHFNHGLRGAESDGDEQFVAALAARLQLPFFTGRDDVAAVARAKHWNLEDAGRRLRYEFFAAMVAEGRIDRVAVAHTADDQAETVLARILRGSGTAGLAAIYPVRGHIVRPLLEMRRAELREYLGHLAQPWREDASNFDRSRLRSRLRHDVLPVLEREVRPGVVSHLGQLAALAREDEAFWKTLTRASLDVLVTREGDELRIRCADLLNPSGGTLFANLDLPQPARWAVTRRLVRGIVKEMRGHYRQWTADHVERVVQLAAAGSSGNRVELPGIIVGRSFEWLRFSPAKRETGRAIANSEVNSCVSQAFSHVVELGGPGESTVVAVPEIGCRFRLKVVDWHLCQSDTYDDKSVLDRDLLNSPLVLRNWLPGDSFQPKGRRSSRKLKQFLRMERVPVSDRAGWPVLTSKNMLVWTRGLPVAAGFAPQAATRAGVIIGEEKF